MSWTSAVSHILNKQRFAIQEYVGERRHTNRHSSIKRTATLHELHHTCAGSITPGHMHHGGWAELEKGSVQCMTRLQHKGKAPPISQCTRKKNNTAPCYEEGMNSALATYSTGISILLHEWPCACRLTFVSHLVKYAWSTVMWNWKNSIMLFVGVVLVIQ